MKTNILSSLARLSDHELLERVRRLVRCEREATAGLVAHLAALDQRSLYLAEGCSSLFTYCAQVLHLSEHAAYGRIQAARAARKFPVILDLLSNGALNLTAVGLLAPRLTPENHRELLSAARHKSKRQVEELVARVRPQPSLPATVRKLPAVRRMSGQQEIAAAGALQTAAAGGAMQPPAPIEALHSPATIGGLQPPAVPGVVLPWAEGSRAPSTASTPARRALVTALAPERYRVQFTVSGETHEKLRRAQDLLRHEIPDGDPAAVFERALSVLLEHLTKTKFAATARPRASRGTARPRARRGTTPGSRHIPAAVRRAVWERDGGRCAFVSRKGRRCREPGFLEFHHVSPHGDGGEATVENIELRCRAHNKYEAELYFGSRWTPAEKKSVVRESPAARRGRLEFAGRGRARDGP